MEKKDKFALWSLCMFIFLYIEERLGHSLFNDLSQESIPEFILGTLVIIAFTVSITYLLWVYPILIVVEKNKDDSTPIKKAKVK